MPAGFIPPCQPKVAKRPPAGSGWVHELKHDGYRLQIHARDGRVRLYTMNGANWSDPLSTHCGRCGAQIKGHAIIDAEVVCLDSKGIAQSWIKVKNPKAPAATRILDGTF